MSDSNQPPWSKLYPVEPFFIPALKVGAWSGASGLLVGGVGGIFRSPTPGLFAIASGLQCAALGTAYYGTREAILRAWQVTPSSPRQDRMYPSTLAGSFTGGIAGGLIRGRKNIIPGIIMFSLFGFAGQYIYNALDVRQGSLIALKDSRPSDINSVTMSRSDQIQSASTNPNKSLNQPIWRRVFNSKWSPMKVLSDEEYEKMLRQKLLRADAEIAILDDDIAKAKAKLDADKRS
ncbi:MAG: hypothetical protein Q9203_003413 [Teloschistes exilis]